MKNVVVHDTCEVFLKTLESSSKLYYVGITATSNVNQAIDQTPISGGIGNKRITTISNNKNIAFDVTTTLHDDDAYVLQGGADFASGTVSIWQQETVQAVDATGVIKVTITGTPTDGVTVFDKFGKEYVGAFADAKVSITGGKAGEYYTVVYTITTPSGDVMDLDSEKMPKTCSAQLHTIAYDPDTEEVVADIYWIFDKVRGDGAFGAAYAAGTNMQDSMKFNCETPIGSKSYGKYAVIKRSTT